MPQGISLCGRPERSYRPKVRHFAVVDAILYPPKVSSEQVVDDVGTDGNNRRNGSKASSLWLTCLLTLTTAVQGECRAELARAMLSRSPQCRASQLHDKGTTSAKGDVRLCPTGVKYF